MLRPACAVLFAAVLSIVLAPAPAAAVPPAVANAIPDTTISEGSPAIRNYRDLNKVFFDVEDGDSLAFTIESNSNPALVFPVIDADSALGMSFAPNSSGAATLVIRATDSEALVVEDTLTVTVAPVNDPPFVVSAIPDTVVLVGSPPIDGYVDLNDVFSDIEDGSSLVFTIQSNSDPTAVNVSIDADSAIDLSFFPDTHGTATIVVRATDAGGLFVDDTFVVTVHRTFWLVKPDGSGHEPTIQAAVNLAFDGDTLMLADGTYTGTGNHGIDLGGRQILITSQHGPELTIIDLEGADRGFIMDNVGPGGTLSNITITNGRQNQGACLKMSSASPVISGMVFAGNVAGANGGAVWCDLGSSPTIADCIFIGNRAVDGGGIYSNNASPTIRNCTIVESAATTGGAGIHMRNSGGSISNTIIANSTQGPGLACANGSTFTVTCTDIFGNAGGDAICGVDGGGNISADPMFCGPAGSGIVSIDGKSPCAPEHNSCGVLIGALPVACMTGPDLADTPNTLYPNAVFAGEADLVLHIGLDNMTRWGVMLDTISAVTFSDSANTYTATLANPTYVPGQAKNFTATFSSADVPSAIVAPAAYDLKLFLYGTDDSAAAYADTIQTTGRNSIFVDTPRVIVSALPLRVERVLPGARNVPVLSLAFRNGYADARSIDSLVVTNMTFGPGSSADLDAEIDGIRLFDDVDSNGDLSAPDTLVSQSAMAAGEAVFDIGGRWFVGASGQKNLIVAADIDSMLARDSDEVDVAVTGPEHVVFQGSTLTNTDFSPLYPLTSYGHAVVDGMARHQIGIAPAAVDTLLGGSRNVCLLTMAVPQNGYTADTLTTFSIMDFAGDFSPSDVAAVHLYRDDGNGAFDPTLDTDLGALVFSGDRYDISGLRETLSPSVRFFVVCDVAGHAVNGHHFRPGVPVDGIDVKSSNDGPLDGPAVSGKTLVVENPEVVEVTNLSLTADTPTPGSTDVRLLHVSVANKTRGPVTLDSVTLQDVSRGAGTIHDLDHTLSNVRVYSDDGNGVIDGWDAILADDLHFASGSITASGLDFGIAMDGMTYLLVAADIDSFCAADGDTLAVRVDGPAAIGIREASLVTGTFPAATLQPLVVEGMKAFQIALTPGADSLIVTAGTRVLLLNAGIPANGYAPDTLRTLTIRNEGTATSEHFDRILLYVDGGDGRYDEGSGDDSYVGDLIENPADPERSFMITGLVVPLAPPCGTHKRVYAAADIALEYSVAGTIRFSVPVNGVRVASGNDGPIDRAVIDPTLRMIPKPDQLTVFPYPAGDQTVYPGSQDNLNFGVGFYNGYTYPLGVQKIKFYQVGTISSTELDSVFVYADSDGNGLFSPLFDAQLAAAGGAGVSYALTGLDLQIEPGKISYLFVTYDLPLSVTDSSTVDFRLFGSTDISVDPPGSEIEGDFPINSPGTDVVDGMIADQIALGSVAASKAAPDDQDVVAMNLVIPANGIWADELEYVAVENQGTAGGGDIANMRLWKEAGGDPARFDPGEEDPLDYLDRTGSSWRNSSPLGVPIPTSGLRVYVTFSVSLDPDDGATVQMRLPLRAIEAASGNDGPIDRTVTNPTTQTISTDPLIATLLADRQSYSTGQMIVLSMITRNEGLDTLYGVHPSLVTASGSGSASVSSTPNPAATNIPPGASTTFVWTYAADAAGDLAFCARAYSADSSDVSEEACTESLVVQNRSSGVTVTLTNLAPSTADRGQEGVRLFELKARNTAAGPLAASIRFTEILLNCNTGSGVPLAPNAVLRRLVFVDPEGADLAFALADSTNPALRLKLETPAVVPPGATLTLHAAADISAAAALTSIAFKINALDDIRISDANDGVEAPKTSTNAFAWSTTPIAVNTAAESLFVDSMSGMTTTSNVGQENVHVFAVDVTHRGMSSAARVIVTDLRLAFNDLGGTAIVPSDVVRRLRVIAGASVLFDEDVVTGPETVFDALLRTPLVLSSGSSQRLDIEVDLKSAPSSSGFAMALDAPGSVIARDINTGQIVRVAAADPALRDFPFTSDRIVFQNPATGLRADFADRFPDAVLPSARAVPVMDLIVALEDAVGSSSVRIDSLSFDFLASGGAVPVLPGDFFSALFVTHDGDTVGVQTSLSGTSSSAACRLRSPVMLAPSASETLSVFVDAKAVFSPADIEVRLDTPGLVVHDANDGTRIYGIPGPFPFVAGPASLQLPSRLAFAGLVSRAPANVASRESNVGAFDLVLQNGDAAGRTAVDLETVRIRAQGTNGSSIDPTRVASGARLATSDSTIVEGTMDASGIVFALPAGLVRVASGASDTLLVALDIESTLDDASFRLSIEDTTSLGIRDAVTGRDIAAGTIDGSGFPLVTGWIHVLGRSAESAYTNYPNPFAAGREKTTITYYLEEKSTVTMKLYTLWGAPVRTLVDRRSVEPGLHQDVTWDGRNGGGDVVNNGVYYLVLEIRGDNGNSATLKRKVGVIR